MKTTRLLVSFLAIAVAISMASCDDEDPFTESQEGKNTLGFHLDGQKIKHLYSGFPFVAPFARRVSGWYDEEDDTFSLSASLDDEVIYDIGILLTLPDIPDQKKYKIGDKGVELAARISYYLTPPDPSLSYDMIKDTTAIAQSGYIEFTKFDMINEIASGRFEFDMDFVRPDHTTFRRKVTNGMFDVSFVTYKKREEETDEPVPTDDLQTPVASKDF